jgi:RNA polymerase sigma factor (sigma-70 family)
VATDFQSAEPGRLAIGRHKARLRGGSDFGKTSAMSDRDAVHLQRCLERLQQGDETARKELLEGACERLLQLARVMLRDYPRLRRWEETGDVLQNALIRLDRALQTVRPATLRDFYRLATLEVRRELLDLVRHHFGPLGEGGRHQSGTLGEHEVGNASLEPGQLAVWSEFHRAVEQLPDEEREAFELVWYQGLGHTEAAQVLDVSARTVKRRWQSACLKLHEALGGELPGAPA